MVSLDGHLHAVNPDGSLKWKTNVGAGTSPTIGQDGTIYAGYTKLHAVNPTNGSVKWKFDVGGTMRGGTPCNSIDGTIYVGTSDGGELIAVNPDGTERWRKKIGKYVDSPPVIGEDGAVYVGSDHAPGEGFLHAFGIGELDAYANGPYYGLVGEPIQFEGSSKGGYSPHYYHWDFGDGNTSDEQNPLHTYTYPSNFTVTLTVTDNSSNTSDDTTWAWIQASNDPPNKPSINGKINGIAGQSYDYTFTSTDPENQNVWYYIDWGDGQTEEWIGPCESGEEVTKSHTWDDEDTYTIRAKAKDIFDAESDWGTLEVSMPVNQPVQYPLLELFRERFPILYQIIFRVLEELNI